MARRLQEPAPQPVDTATTHVKAVVALAYSSDGRLVVTAGADTKASVVSAATGAVVGELEGAHKEGLNDVCWVDERLVVTASDDNTLVLSNRPNERARSERASTVGPHRGPLVQKKEHPIYSHIPMPHEPHLHYAPL